MTETTTRPRGALPEIWHDYQQRRSPELRNQLVLQYSPLVKYVAGRMRAELPSSIETADLVSEGILGLMNAVDRFDPGRGLQFPTYAVPRIRGAIMDSLRAADWVPRSVRGRVRTVERATERLHEDLGRAPTEQEISAETGIPVADLRSSLTRPMTVSVAADDDLAGVSEGVSQLDDLFESEENRDLVRSALTQLPERDRIVMALYFFEGFTLSEIGTILGVTESRASQLRSRAIATMRSTLAQRLVQD
ncbi:FliA/WhiG family RNA polymerase sigma factor [Nocardioides mangrovi]|uniref:FliA/WhiG family RNA polymerase sigma factor n=1 Tax=Nocardioides mangrovi TaxID=2874580 RepID=A0ABS7UIE7_9ACTN|nr:FliA/WhiG family RNA polymerase sigma factor [Nocardioides mangrovi]MBZ5740016.1 FliA/WhiG family RNA polymerase sigma factor [Nocardioides mangrovi]MBZ5740813.1 FliA/WhiG family RNA polymerase sigma factor [Nocardioides mangrovi]